jgi:excisionase family DNA binding protein
MDTSHKVTLLTIGEASKLLGVSEPTLRNWTDQGEIKAFITPGGHRRFAEADLVNLVRRKQDRKLPEQIEATIKEVAPREHQVVEDYLLSTRWYPRLGESARQELRERGTVRERAHQEAGTIGKEYGLQLSGLGLSLNEAIEAFVLHRAPLLDAASRLIKSRGGSLSRRTQEALLHVSNLTDRMLLSLVEAYQEPKKPKQRTKAKGEAE